MSAVDREIVCCRCMKSFFRKLCNCTTLVIYSTLSPQLLLDNISALPVIVKSKLGMGIGMKIEEVNKCKVRRREKASKRNSWFHHSKAVENSWLNYIRMEVGL